MQVVATFDAIGLYMLRFVAILLSLAGTSNAQEITLSNGETRPLPRPAQLIGEASTEREWIAIGTNVNAQYLIDILNESGYTVDPSASWVSSAEEFSVYTTTLAPGEI
jgi:hypothetical protein